MNEKFDFHPDEVPPKHDFFPEKNNNSNKNSPNFFPPNKSNPGRVAKTFIGAGAAALFFGTLSAISGGISSIAAPVCLASLIAAGISALCARPDIALGCLTVAAISAVVSITASLCSLLCGVLAVVVGFAIAAHGVSKEMANFEVPQCTM